MVNQLQYRKATIAVGVALVILLLGALFVGYVQPMMMERSAEKLVTDFGAALKNVSLAGEEELVRSEIENQYGKFVSPELLEKWKADPSIAPGRDTSSPWPERIEISSISKQGSGYIVSGNIVLMTSEEVTAGGDAGKIPVVMLVVLREGKWQIVAFEAQQSE